MTTISARRLNEDARFQRRMRFAVLFRRFKRDRPKEKAVELVAKEFGVSTWTVYDVLRGRR